MNDRNAVRVLVVLLLAIAIMAVLVFVHPNWADAQMKIMPCTKGQLCWQDNFFAPVNNQKPSMERFNITVGCCGVLNPKPDITAEEAAWLDILLTIGFASSMDYNAAPPDYAGFIKLHHLQRHFDKAEP